MDGFLVLESQLIKVEVEEHLNFHCIVCNAEFLSRSERNDHLETHFVHRSCKQCSRPVIIIGDLEFELHHPNNCKQTEPIDEAVFEQDEDEHDYAMDDEIEIHDEVKEESVDKCVTDNDLPAKRSKSNVNYREDEEETHSEGQAKVKKQRPARKSKRKRNNITKGGKKSHHVKEIEVENSNFDAECADESYSDQKADTESEDEVVKEMNKSLKKPRKQYSRLPKTVPCTQCDVMFGTERTLKIHMHQVHGIKERYICPICSREFKIGGNLKQHIETHSDYKRFICNYCGKGFHLPYNLKEHMNTHTGARPYKCETCGKTFGRNTLRQAHMRIHTGEKPYKCTAEDCDRAYAYQTDLKRHRRSVHGIITKTFPCPICSKVFYENKFLTKHLNVHQGNV